MEISKASIQSIPNPGTLKGMNTKTFLRSALYIVWGAALVWGVISADNTIRPVLAALSSNAHPFVYDVASVAVMLFVAFMPIIWAPGFFGYKPGTIRENWKMLLGMALFFVGAPLIYRMVLGNTPFSANTWFFEGIVVPIAEEGFFRGVLLSMLLWGFREMYKESTAGWLTVLFSTLIFSTAHLNNFGDYPTGFILFQVGFSTILGLAFGYTRVKTESIYPAFILHALFNLAGTI